jgi:hypothetical protein
MCQCRSLGFLDCAEKVGCDLQVNYLAATVMSVRDAESYRSVASANAEFCLRRVKANRIRLQPRSQLMRADPTVEVIANYLE